MNSHDPVTLPAFPAPLRWLHPPASWTVEEADSLVVRAPGGTDLFTDPNGESAFNNAPCLIGTLEGDFTLSARVQVAHAAAFDAGVLLLYASEQAWAKFCLERSPQHHLTVVSVVTRGVSDDCNSIPVSTDSVGLRISRVGPAYAFHARTDAGPWHLIRYFALAGKPEVGFLVQSPLGEGCTVRFDDITYSPQRLADLRDGT